MSARWQNIKEMGQRLYAAANRFSGAEQRRDRDAFWHWIYGTLVHIQWGGGQWMSRFDGWQRPETPISESDHYLEDWSRPAAGACNPTPKSSAGPARSTGNGWMVTSRSAAQRKVTAPKQLLVTHFFNHQTHHRNQRRRRTDRRHRPIPRGPSERPLTLRVFGCLPVTARRAARRQGSEKPRRR